MSGVFAANGLETYLFTVKWFNTPTVVDPNLQSSIRANWQSVKIFLFAELPDLLSIGIVLLLLFTKDPKIGYVAEMLLFPLLGLLLIVVGVYQRNSIQTQNITRRLVSSPFFTIMGYCSYPIYLFQIIFLDVYVPKFYAAIHADGSLVWKDIPIWQRIILVLGLIAFCWITQKYYADPVSAYTYPRLKRLLDSRS